MGMKRNETVDHRGSSGTHAAFHLLTYVSKAIPGKCQPTFSRKCFALFSMTIDRKHA